MPSENTGLRAQVCPVAGQVYVFGICDALAQLQAGIAHGRYHNHSVLPNAAEAQVVRGYWVPPADLRPAVLDAGHLIATQRFCRYDAPVVNHAKAVQVVRTLHMRHNFWRLVRQQDLEVIPNPASDTSLLNLAIQVSFDYRGGEGLGCTGKLLLHIQDGRLVRLVDAGPVFG
jgi:hypothetical protein